jgi:hypothetical protein
MAAVWIFVALAIAGFAMAGYARTHDLDDAKGFRDTWTAVLLALRNRPEDIA